MACPHLQSDSMLHKGSINSFDDSGVLERKRLESPCPLCKIVYPLRASYSETYHVPSKLSRENRNEAEIPAINSHICWARPTDDKSLEKEPIPLALEFLDHDEPRNISVRLEHDEFGEAYHVLVCGLLLKHSTKHSLHIVLKDSASDGIGELLRWYDMKHEHAGPVDGKGNATDIIHAAFNACQDPSKTTPNPKNIEAQKRALHPTQDGLFSFIRASLELEWKKYIHGRKDTDVDLDEYYFRPSYAAKYWLNRYLRLTSRPRLAKGWTESEQRKARESPMQFELSNWPELPDESEVSRLAVIHIRRTPKTDVGRIMDEENLKTVARSIVDANYAAKAGNEQQFSHVMLYGDFYYSLGLDLKEMVEICTDHQISVGFVSRMWECDKEDPRCDDQESERLWAKYRDFNFDHIPVQVKNLAVWVELCYRYAPKICVIGHRSGFIEAAALVGIPTFYLNNEREKISRGKDFMTAGDILWRPMENLKGSRLRLLGEVMDTFIAIESLYEPDPKDASNRTNKSSKQASETSNDGKKKQSKNDEAPKEIYRVHKDYKDELAAALFMFMCCELIPNKPDPGDPGNPVKATLSGSVPAWTQRVHLIHYNNRKGWPKLEKKLRALQSFFSKLREEVRQVTRQLRKQNPNISWKKIQEERKKVREAAAVRFRDNSLSESKDEGKTPARLGSEWRLGAIGRPTERLRFEGRLGQQWLKANYDFAISAIKEAENRYKPKSKPNQNNPNNSKARIQPNRQQGRSYQYKQFFNWQLVRGRMQRLSVIEVHFDDKSRVSRMA